MEALVGGVACEGRRGGGKRKNVKYLSNGPKRKSSYGLRAGSKGFLVTCDKGQERSTMKEAINLLDEFYERLVEGANATINSKDNQFSQLSPHIIRHDLADSVENKVEANANSQEEAVESNDSRENEFEGEKTSQVGSLSNIMQNCKHTKTGVANDHIKNIDDALELELAQLRDKRKVDSSDGRTFNFSVRQNQASIVVIERARFIGLDTGCAGIVFVEMLRDDNVRPLELVKSIIRTVVTSKQSRTRFCLRLLPVEVTCYASQSEVKRAAEPVISHYFSQENGDDGLKFAVVYEARANTSLDRMEIINAVAQLVPKHHSVDLKNPDITIIVQIVKTTCAIGIAHEFKEMAKYNLKQIVLQKAES
ncbi:hypothetical protein O6H91_18G041500 [Diphasiastrum complanatum]|uniref:Uncharacterized protein n=1 Tax=Diphasiastrum complanatum TaxID=34168 RepID=A0ACC2B0E5_DIPCM|nr:hypothetical protein O6H91_18G041500 [Diphasiastrum complanatum]